jgi:hypothetical protein
VGMDGGQEGERIQLDAPCVSLLNIMSHGRGTKMENENMTIWNKVKSPPASALKQIKAGRLQGMTDINPQWRYKAMTEAFGVCGIGWKYEINRLSLEPAVDGQIMAFSEVFVFIWNKDKWSDPIPGIGGSSFVAKEKSGLHASDECFKMATTDALSVAMKMLGVGADIYSGRWDGSKYKDEKKEETKQKFQTLSLADWKKSVESSTIESYEQLVEWRKQNGPKIKDTLPVENHAEFKAYLDGLFVLCPENDKHYLAASCEAKPCAKGCPVLKEEK